MQTRDVDVEKILLQAGLAPAGLLHTLHNNSSSQHGQNQYVSVKLLNFKNAWHVPMVLVMILKMPVQNNNTKIFTPPDLSTNLLQILTSPTF